MRRIRKWRVVRPQNSFVFCLRCWKHDNNNNNAHSLSLFLVQFYHFTIDIFFGFPTTFILLCNYPSISRFLCYVFDCSLSMFIPCRTFGYSMVYARNNINYPMFRIFLFNIRRFEQF